jgi:hypothetical protein
MFCPTHGIKGETAGEFLALPNVACFGGSWLTPGSVRSRARQAATDSGGVLGSALDTGVWAARGALMRQDREAVGPIAKTKKLPKLPDLVERDQRAFDWEYDATDRNTAAWPAELPPPTTITSSPPQSCASIAVAA